MTTTGYPLRTAELRLAGVLVKVPRVLIAALLWLMVIEALRGVAQWGVLAVVVGGTVASVVAEPAVVRLVWGARQPSASIVVPGDPHVSVLVTRRNGAAIGHAGRRHLIVPAALVGRADLPSLLSRARLRQVVSAGRLDVAYEWFTWPWQVAGSFINGFAHGVAQLPLIGFAWRVRPVITGIALWQSTEAGRIPAAVGIIVVIGLTYLLPWTTTHHERLIRQAVSEVTRPVAAPALRSPAARTARPPANDGRRPCTRAARGRNSSCGQWRLAAPSANCRGEGTRGSVHDRRTTGRKGIPS